MARAGPGAAALAVVLICTLAEVAGGISAEPPKGPFRGFFGARPVEDCAATGYVLSVPDSAEPCPSPTFEWTRDGDVVPGETGSRLELPPESADGTSEWRVRVTCGVDCTIESNPRRLAQGPTQSKAHT